MQSKIIAGVFVVAMAIGMPTSVDAGHRGFVPRRVVRSYQRDTRQFQRQTSRSFNQFDRNLNRSFRQAPRSYGYAPRSSGIYLGGSRGGVFIRF